MTKLLEQGIRAAHELPADRQDMAGELLLALTTSEPRYHLTREQIEDLTLAVVEADRGEFAGEVEMADAWRKLGL
jgi:hypothetical protein